MATLATKLEKKGLCFDISKKSDKGYVTIYLNFNPIKRSELIDMIEGLPSVNEITCIMRHDNHSGSFALLLHKEFDSEMLKNEIDSLLDHMIV